MIAYTEKLTHKQKFEILSELKSSYGRTSLLLSGGGQLGFYHFGFIKQLIQHKIMPKVVAGSSAGSLIVAAIGCYKKEDLLKRINKANWDLKVLEKKGKLMAPVRKLLRFISNGNLLDICTVQQTLLDIFGKITFKEAFQKTGNIINITILDANKFESFQVLNYLTAPNVMIWSAASASYSLPGLFGPSKIYCKNQNGEVLEWLPGEKMFIDGSLDADLPIRRISEMFHTNYSIASQANPFVIPFMSRSKNKLASKKYFFWKVYKYFSYLIYSQIQHRSRQLAKTGL